MQTSATQLHPLNVHCFLRDHTCKSTFSIVTLLIYAKIMRTIICPTLTIWICVGWGPETLEFTHANIDVIFLLSTPHRSEPVDEELMEADILIRSKCVQSWKINYSLWYFYNFKQYKCVGSHFGCRKSTYPGINGRIFASAVTYSYLTHQIPRHPPRLPNAPFPRELTTASEEGIMH